MRSPRRTARASTTWRSTKRSQKLARLDERQARIVELRFFAGLEVDEVARVLGVSPRTVAGDWAMAKAFLHAELQPGERA
jgi:RNA polymerase sigma factor (sigma-70 family)